MADLVLAQAGGSGLTGGDNVVLVGCEVGERVELGSVMHWASVS